MADFYPSSTKPDRYWVVARNRQEARRQNELWKRGRFTKFYDLTIEEARQAVRLINANTAITPPTNLIGDVG